MPAKSVLRDKILAWVVSPIDAARGGDPARRRQADDFGFRAVEDEIDLAFLGSFVVVHEPLSSQQLRLLAGTPESQRPREFDTEKRLLF